LGEEGVVDRLSTKPVVRVLEGGTNATPPIWLMRQAGRYLPEYRAIRERCGSFLDLCFNPKLAAEVTVQPIHRFGFDAAILFSDILVIPHALGQRVSFEAGEGPRLEAIDGPAALARLNQTIDHDALAPIYETIGLVKAQLSAETTLLGFCGAPWTLATYMVAGFGASEQIPARLFGYRHPAAFAELIDRLATASAGYLIRQFKAGVDAVQIFDTWSGVLPPAEFEKWCIEPCAKIVAAVRSEIPDAKIIGFPRAAATKLSRYVDEVPVNAVGLDWMLDLDFARDRIQSQRPVQGNLDPLVLLAGGEALDRQIDAILAAFAPRPFIFNLGHGILPETPIAHVERLIKRVRGQ
jgi:uroporphyrinogen decarboxylase